MENSPIWRFLLEAGYIQVRIVVVMANPFSLQGETALITGGGTGLGFGIAKSFVQAGAQVVLVGRRVGILKEAVNKLGSSATFEAPVHVFTSGDEAELFLNGKSLGRKKKGQYEYRLRWDDAAYQPGTLKVIAYKNGKPWATDEVKTAGEPAKLKLEPDRSTIGADGHDLSFVTVKVKDKAGLTAPRADIRIHFDIEGPGEIVATDNGDPTSFESFQSHDRKAFNGLCLLIVRGIAGQPGTIKLAAKADGLKIGTASIQTTLKTN
jgi:Glycoside hydrolase family 2 C-terminal domain 5/Domain of unknown function (DUF4982)/short chain dehydrogenase